VRRLARLALVAVVAVTALTVAGVTAREPATAQSAPILRLVDQSGPVTGNGVFSLRFRVGDPGPGSTLLVNLYDRLTSRSAFQTSLTGIPVGAALASTTPRAISDFETDETGTIEHLFDLNDGSLPHEDGQVQLTREGVYPVVVEARDRFGNSISRMVTYLIRLPDPGSAVADRLAPLSVAWIMDVRAPPARRPDGSLGFSSADRDRLTTWIDSLARHPDVETTVTATPETVESLLASPDPTDRALGRRLVERVDAEHVLAAEYVDIDPAALADVGLADQAADLRRQGEAVLNREFGGFRPTTWVARPGTSTAELVARRDDGVREVVLSGHQLTPRTPAPVITPARPFELQVGNETLDAVEVDEALQRHFTTSDPILGANQLLAELSMLQFDRPVVPRGVVVTAPQDWTPNPAFLDVALDGLARSPLLQATAVQDLFDLELDAGDDGRPISREFVGGEGDRFRGSVDLYDLTLERLGALESMVTDRAGQTLVDSLETRLEPSLASDLSATGKAAYWNTVRDEVETYLVAVQPPPGDTFTLTGREDAIPLRFRNDSDLPLQVKVTYDAEKLEFPTGPEDLLTLPANEVLDTEVSVKVLTSGSFPVRIDVTSPDGIVPLTTSRVTIRSVVLSGLGVILSVGAVAFLAIWWALDIRRGRRARNHPAPA
jgi:Family of unknown function (DUF6049)